MDLKPDTLLQRLGFRDSAGICYDANGIVVRETLFRGHHARLLIVDDALQSAVALEEGERQTLLFPYMRAFEWAHRIRSDIRSALLIGGGGFVYPDHFLHYHPSATMDVVELSEEILALSRRFFFLKAIEAEFPDRFTLHKTDGFSYLLGCDRRFDLILNDAFTGNAADGSLSSTDGISLIHSHLTEGGLYLCNIAAAYKGLLSLRGKQAKRRAERQFKHVTYLQADDARDPMEGQNCILIASDHPL